jgi:hypothetical protein
MVDMTILGIFVLATLYYVRKWIKNARSDTSSAFEKGRKDTEESELEAG